MLQYLIVTMKGVDRSRKAMEIVSTHLLEGRKFRSMERDSGGSKVIEGQPKRSRKTNDRMKQRS